jgi:hypothetical protein
MGEFHSAFVAHDTDDEKATLLQDKETVVNAFFYTHRRNRKLQRRRS